MSAFITVLDPDEVSVNRTALDLNSGAIRVLQDGIDWGDDAIQAYESDSKTGSVMVDYRKPNRIISIPLIVGADDTGQDGFTSASKLLRAKVGLIERQGGWLKRDSGNGPMYADIVTATLTFPDHWGEVSGIEPDVVLKLEALPDFYGDEVALTTLSSTNGILSAVVTLGGVANLIEDPSFEYDAIGATPAGWEDNSTGTTLAVTSAWADDGSQSLEYEFTSSSATTAYPGVAVAVDGITAGADYYMQLSYEEVQNTSGTTPTLAVSWADADGTFLEHDAFDSVTLADGLCSGFVTAPTGAASATFQFFYTTTAKNKVVHFYVDAALVVASSAPVTYADGDTVGYQWSGTPGDSTTISNTDIEGDYPARCRIVVTDTAGLDRHGLLYGLRSTHYDSADTAALVYEAEDLSPINGATINAEDTAASGGSEVDFSIPTGDGNTWTPMLLTSLADGSPLTHQGTYRVLARVKSNADLSMRLAWSIGTLAVPITNDPVAVANGPWWLVDFGVVRLAQQPVGANAWYGVVQVYGAEAAIAVVDQLIILPLDDSSGELTYVPPTGAAPPQLTSSVTGLRANATTATGNGATGGYGGDWGQQSGPTNDLLYPKSDGTDESATTWTTGTITFGSLGFDIPDGATILGITATVRYGGLNGADTDSNCADISVSLTGGDGTATEYHTGPEGRFNNGIDPNAQWDSAYCSSFTLGAQNDLWGTTWTPADINSDDFAVVTAITVAGLDQGVTPNMVAAPPIVTVYYQLESGFAIPDDAVLYAGRAAELRTEGMYRTYDGNVYGPISTVNGDLPRLPPSGAEGRPCELVVRPSVGEFDTEGDGSDASALADFTVQVFYRPSYLFRP